MKKALVKGLFIIVEAGIEVLAERIKKRSLRNGNPYGMHHLGDGRGAYDLRDRSADHLRPLGAQRAMTRKRGRRPSISWER